MRTDVVRYDMMDVILGEVSTNLSVSFLRRKYPVWECRGSHSHLIKGVAFFFGVVLNCTASNFKLDRAG